MSINRASTIVGLVSIVMEWWLDHCWVSLMHWQLSEAKETATWSPPHSANERQRSVNNFWSSKYGSWIVIWSLLGSVSNRSGACPSGPGLDQMNSLVRFQIRSKPNPLCLDVGVSCTWHKTIGFWPGSNWTAVQSIWFLQLFLQLSVWVLIVSRHHEYADCVLLGAISPPALRFAIRLILVEWL